VVSWTRRSQIAPAIVAFREVGPMQTKTGAKEWERKLRSAMLNPRGRRQGVPDLAAFVRDP
jgi:hypothetical protein